MPTLDSNGSLKSTIQNASTNTYFSQQVEKSIQLSQNHTLSQLEARSQEEKSLPFTLTVM